MQIFHDKSLTNPLTGKTLVENRTYYIQLEKPDPSIRAEVESGRYKRFFDLHPDNTVGTVSFDNVVGIVNLFGAMYEVRSSKFLESKSGDDQVRSLLKDIDRISQTLPFAIASLQDFSYQVDRSLLTTSLYFRYIYFRNLAFHKQAKRRLSYYCEQILNNMHFKLERVHSHTSITRITNISHNSVKHLVSHSGDFTTIEDANPLSRSPLANYIPCELNGKRFFPKTIYSQDSQMSFDTHENRFIKYFLKQIVDICLFVSTEYGYMPHLQKEAKALAKLILTILVNPAFLCIGALSYIPYQSAVLQTRGGYKEMLYHYYQSRLAPKGIYSYIENDFDLLDLKSISTLYEYWTFFQVVEALFGDGAVVRECRRVGGYDNLQFNFCVAKNDTAVYYNRAMTRSTDESYALNFRPDITIELSKEGEIVRRFILDSKYKVDKFDGNMEEIADEISSYKVEDLIKMLCYMESIKNCDAAIILYPGTDFIFYEKDISTYLNPKRDLSSIGKLRGVGAVPVSPGNDTSEEIFRGFMELIKTELSVIL